MNNIGWREANMIQEERCTPCEFLAAVVIAVLVFLALGMVS